MLSKSSNAERTSVSLEGRKASKALAPGKEFRDYQLQWCFQTPLYHISQYSMCFNKKSSVQKNMFSVDTVSAGRRYKIEASK